MEESIEDVVSETLKGLIDAGVIDKKIMREFKEIDKGAL